MHYLGLDLAWGSRARTGVAVLDAAGRLVFSSSVRSDDEIAALVQEYAPGDLVAAIDAPLVVPNETGRRPCEAMVGALFSRYYAGAYPANRGNPAFNPQPRGARLAQRLGWSMDPSVRPGMGRRVAIEVYPHPAMVVLFELDTVIHYKAKRGRDLEMLREAYALLLAHLERGCGPLLGSGRTASACACWPRFTTASTRGGRCLVARSRGTARPPWPSCWTSNLMPPERLLARRDRIGVSGGSASSRRAR